jgi:hypothetical protein
MAKRRSFNTARHQRQTYTRLVLGGLLVLVGVGGGLVWVIYGGTAAVTAVACLLGATGILGLLWFILTLMELWVKDDDL